MSARYGYLSVLAQPCDVVVFPDGERVVVARGDGPSHAAAWTPGGATAPVHVPDEVSRRLARQREEHAAWSRRLDAALDASMSITHGRMIREAFVTENPEPPVEGGAASGDEHTTAQIVTSTWWRARLEGTAERLESWLDEAQQPFPRGALIDTLNALAERGWSVVQLSEDRKAVHDGDASRTEIIAAWFLLEAAQ